MSQSGRNKPPPTKKLTINTGCIQAMLFESSQYDYQPSSSSIISNIIMVCVDSTIKSIQCSFQYAIMFVVAFMCIVQVYPDTCELFCSNQGGDAEPYCDCTWGTSGYYYNQCLDACRTNSSCMTAAGYTCCLYNVSNICCFQNCCGTGVTGGCTGGAPHCNCITAQGQVVTISTQTIRSG